MLLVNCRDPSHLVRDLMDLMAANVMWTQPGDRYKESACKDYLSWKIDITTAIIWSRRM